MKINTVLPCVRHTGWLSQHENGHGTSMCETHRLIVSTWKWTLYFHVWDTQADCLNMKMDTVLPCVRHTGWLSQHKNGHCTSMCETHRLIVSTWKWTLYVRVWDTQADSLNMKMDMVLPCVRHAGWLSQHKNGHCTSMCETHRLIASTCIQCHL